MHNIMNKINNVLQKVKFTEKEHNKINYLSITIINIPTQHKQKTYN